MQFPQRATYTKSEINRAGDTIRTTRPNSAAYKQAIDILNEWRVSHHYPMHTFNMTLRHKAYVVDREAIVVRRLKRRETILDKIKNRESKMRLSAMQDIGGVRAIVRTPEQVAALVAQYTEPGRFSHRLVRMKDYIQEPKDSGYRSVHMVFEFNNTQGRGAHARDYDGLLVEVQLRTDLQHIWATAVEAIGIMLHEELKSSRGSRKWLDFFAYMSSVMAMLEGQRVLPTHRGMSKHDIIQRAYRLIKELNVENIMSGWAIGINAATRVDKRGTGRHYVIIALQPTEKSTTIYRFKEDALDLANQERERLEQEAAEKGDPDPVLVSVGDIRDLQRAYPNYFLDIRRFLEIVSMVVETVENKV